MNVESKIFSAPEDQVAHLGMDPVPAKYYYDPDWYELERKAIFMRSWIWVGHVCELPEPGTWIRRELEFADASILIVRGKDSQLRAFYNACTHRGTQLVEEESGKGANFLCPYHFWNFGDDGRLIAAPDFNRFAVTKEECKIPKVSVDSVAGQIFVNLDPNPKQGLREYLGAYADEMETVAVAKATTFHEYVYEVDANWKIAYDNFQENYHLRHVHLLTAGGGAVNADNTYGYPEEITFDGPHRYERFWRNPTPVMGEMQGYSLGLTVQGVMNRGLLGGPQDSGYFALFPCFFQIGNPIQLFSHQIYPISATKSRGVIRVHWVGEAANASERYGREYSFGSIHDVHTEDVNIINRAQKGLLSGAIKNIHFMSMEAMCRHLFQQSVAAVEAYQAECAAAGEQA